MICHSCGSSLAFLELTLGRAVCMTAHGLPDRASAFPAAFHLAVVTTAPAFLALRCMEALRCVEESSLALRWVDGPLPIDEHGRRTSGRQGSCKFSDGAKPLFGAC